MLDRGAVRGAEGRAAMSLPTYEISYFRFITYRHSVVDRALFSKRTGQRYAEKQPSFPGRPYIDAVSHRATQANLTRDLNFNGTITGNVHARNRFTSKAVQTARWSLS
jgi:hypothetical protein